MQRHNESWKKKGSGRRKMARRKKKKGIQGGSVNSV